MNRLFELLAAAIVVSVIIGALAFCISYAVMSFIWWDLFNEDVVKGARVAGGVFFSVSLVACVISIGDSI